jgi:hypothetical protein
MSDPRPDDLVIVAYVPNVPIAEMIIGELRNEGIEAFYKPAGTGAFQHDVGHRPGRSMRHLRSAGGCQRAKELLPPQ